MKAQKSVTDIKQLSSDTRHQILSDLKKIYDKHEQSFSQLGKEMAEEYKDVLAEERARSIKVLSAVTDDLRHEVATEVTALKETLTEKTQETETELQQYLKEKYAQVDADVADYKKRQLEKINERVVAVVGNLCAAVLHREMSTTEYEKLLLEELPDELKKAGLS
jgi:molecular chaperone GrpE (heat shock protein)